jgi:hypothetical protein
MSSSAMRVHSSAACASAKVTLCVLRWSADAYLMLTPAVNAMAPPVNPSTAGATWKPGRDRDLDRGGRNQPVYFLLFPPDEWEVSSAPACSAKLIV